MYFYCEVQKWISRAYKKKQQQQKKKKKKKKKKKNKKRNSINKRPGKVIDCGPVCPIHISRSLHVELNYPVDKLHVCRWRTVGELLTLRKHAYSNILKISPPKTKSFQLKTSDIFSYFCSKHRLRVLVRTASLRRF